MGVRHREPSDRSEQNLSHATRQNTVGGASLMKCSMQRPRTAAENAKWPVENPQDRSIMPRQSGRLS
jgi:hypothetical protein